MRRPESNPSMTRNLGPCSHVWARPTGTSRNGTAQMSGSFFSLRPNRWGLTAAITVRTCTRMVVYAGTKHPSFGQGSEALAELAGLTVPEKQVERIYQADRSGAGGRARPKVQAYLSLP